MWREQCSPRQGCSAAWTGYGYCCCSGSTVDDHHVQAAMHVGLWLDASSSQHLHPSPLAHSRRTSNFPDCDWFDPPSRWVDLSGKSLWGSVPLSLPAATIVSRHGDLDVQTGDCWRSKLAGDGILVDDNSALVSGLRLSAVFWLIWLESGGGVATVFIFFDSATRESSFAGACTPVKNVIYCIVQGTNLSKK